MSSVAVFWDRDNTLIKDPGFISDPGQVELLPGAAEAVKRLTAAGFENIIVTNQSGLARGLFDEAALERVHDRLVALFAEQGAKIDAVYFCPFLPGEEAKVEKYRKDSELRKPKPGMILQASIERKIELAGSWMIGDAVRDTQAGRAAGCRTILVRRPGTGDSVRKGADVDFLVESLEQAAATVLKYTRRASGGQSVPPVTSPPHATPMPARREATPPPAPVKPAEVSPVVAVKREEPQPVAPAKPAALPPPAPVKPERVEQARTEQVEPMTREQVEPVQRESFAPVRLDLSDSPLVEEQPAEPAPSAKRGVGDATERAPAKQRVETPPTADTVALLQEILAFMRTVDRRSRAEEFAMGKLVGVIAQIVAVGGLTWALFGLIREEPVEARLGFAILFQLMALTCFVLSPRK